ESYFHKESGLKTSGIVIYLNENFLGDRFLEKEESILLKKLFMKSQRGLEFYGSTRHEVIQLMKELLALEGMKSVIHVLSILELLSRSKEYHYISSRTYDDTL